MATGTIKNLSVSPKSGSGGKTISVSAGVYKGRVNPSTKTITVTPANGGTPKTVTVRLSPASPYFTLNAETITVGSGDNIVITGKANILYVEINRESGITPTSSLQVSQFKYGTEATPIDNTYVTAAGGSIKYGYNSSSLDNTEEIDNSGNHGYNAVFTDLANDDLGASDEFYFQLTLKAPSWDDGDREIYTYVDLSHSLQGSTPDEHKQILVKLRPSAVWALIDGARSKTLTYSSGETSKTIAVTSNTVNWNWANGTVGNVGAVTIPNPATDAEKKSYNPSVSIARWYGRSDSGTTVKYIKKSDATLATLNVKASGVEGFISASGTQMAWTNAEGPSNTKSITFETNALKFKLPYTMQFKDSGGKDTDPESGRKYPLITLSSVTANSKTISSFSPSGGYVEITPEGDPGSTKKYTVVATYALDKKTDSDVALSTTGVITELSNNHTLNITGTIEAGPVWVEVSESSITIPADGSTVTFGVTSNGSWTISNT